MLLTNLLAFTVNLFLSDELSTLLFTINCTSTRSQTLCLVTLLHHSLAHFLTLDNVLTVAELIFKVRTKLRASTSEVVISSHQRCSSLQSFFHSRSYSSGDEILWGTILSCNLQELFTLRHTEASGSFYRGVYVTEEYYTEVLDTCRIICRFTLLTNGELHRLGLLPWGCLTKPFGGVAYVSDYFLFTRDSTDVSLIACFVVHKHTIESTDDQHKGCCDTDTRFLQSIHYLYSSCGIYLVVQLLIIIRCDGNLMSEVFPDHFTSFQIMTDHPCSLFGSEGFHLYARLIFEIRDEEFISIVMGDAQKVSCTFHNTTISTP
ncbi:hypothetical protein D3C78_1084030 [compost metagenome]